MLSRIMKNIQTLMPAVLAVAMMVGTSLDLPSLALEKNHSKHETKGESTGAEIVHVESATFDPRPDSVLMWVRSRKTNFVKIRYEEAGKINPGGPQSSGAAMVSIRPEHDFTGVARLTRLKSGTTYRYFLYAQDTPASTLRYFPPLLAAGQFKTAFQVEQKASVTFVWSGDLGGQGKCRRPDTGYHIFEQILKTRPDFGILLGDLIYADSPCPSPPNLPGSAFVATTLEGYHAKHEYQRNDPALQRFLTQVPVFPVWDDHEVRNDFSGLTDPRMPIGRQAFLDYWPVDTPAINSPGLYRRVQYGPNLELFILDTRQFRSPKSEQDGPSKTMLGHKQRDWLIQGLQDSTATWKIIVSSVPLSVQKGRPHNDSWAKGKNGTGYRVERDKILGSMLTEGIRNVVWLTTDVHFSQILAYDPDANGKTDFYEFICGPLSANSRDPLQLDQTLNANILYENGGFSNFGKVEIDQNSLRLQIIDDTGFTRYQVTLPEV